MSGSAAPLFGFPFGSTSMSMNNHFVDPSYSTYAGPSIGSGGSTYLGSSISAGPSALSHALSAPASVASMNGGAGSSGTIIQAQAQGGESAPGSSKRPFPWASGSGSQERDKRARSCDGGQGQARSGPNSHTSGLMSSGNTGASGNTGGTGNGPGEMWMAGNMSTVDEARSGGHDETSNGVEEASVESSLEEAEADNEENAEETMSTSESAYASAAESPHFNQTFSRSPTQVDTPHSWPLPSVEEYEATNQSFFEPATDSMHLPPGIERSIGSTQHGYPTASTSTQPNAYPNPNPQSTSSAPRIPTPIGLRSSSPLELPDLPSSSSSPVVGDLLSTTGTTGFRPVSPLLNTSSPRHVVLPSGNRPLRLSLFRSPSAPSSRMTRVPSLSIHVLAESRNHSQYDTGGDDNRNEPLRSHQNHEQPDARASSQNPNGGQPLDLGWLTQQLDEALPPPRSLEPFSSTVPLDTSISVSSHFPSTHPAREFSASFGSASVDSVLPLPSHSRAGTGGGLGREPLPWVDIEPEDEGDALFRSVSASGMSDSMVRSISRESGRSTSSAFGDGTSSGSTGMASSSADNSTSVVRVGQMSLPNFEPAFPSRRAGSILSISAGPASPMFGGPSSSQDVESVASTVRSEYPTPGGTLTNQGLSVDTESTPPVGHSAAATFGSPSTSGSSASPRTTPSRNVRRPLSLNLRGFPTSPTFSVSPFPVSGPVSGSPSFIVSDSPTFPASASPRTSAFDLAVTPPGSALPSFAARMMEVDSPVRETAGADGSLHAYNISDLNLGSRVENNAASIDALRRFMQHEESDGDQHTLGASPNQALTDVAVGSYFPESPEPSVRRESMQFALNEGSRATQGESLRSATNGIPVTTSRQATISQPLLENSERVTSALTHHTSQTTHQAEESWSSRPSDLNSVYSQHLTESGITYPSRPSDSGASLPSFRATVSPVPGLNMGSRPGRLVRDMSWSFSDLFRPAHEGSREAPSGSGSETSLRTRVDGREIHEPGETRGGGSRASVRSALARAVRLAGPTRGPESLPRLHLNALPRVGRSSPNEEDEHRAEATASTNLSRTPPAPGSIGNAVPSLAEAWFEGNSSSTQLRSAEFLRPRRMSTTRWTNLLLDATAQPVPTPSMPRPSSNRHRMPPVVSLPPADSTVFDSLSGMSWNRGSHISSTSYIDSSPTDAQARQESAYDTAASLARYQAFAQSIDEIRRSPLPQSQRNSATGVLNRLNPVPAETQVLSSALEGNNARPPWTFPRHESPSVSDQPQQPSRNPYALIIDTHQPPTPSIQGSPREQSELLEHADGNWLREWEQQRDRRSRAARENYIRRRETEFSSNDIQMGVAPGHSESSRRPMPAHRQLAQLSETQAQGQMWNEFNAHPRSRPRPRPMTRASLVATGFANDDILNDWPNGGNGEGNETQLWGSIPRPSRRPEILPARSDEANSSMQFSSNTNEGGTDGMLFTESPPSLLQDFGDSAIGNPYEPLDLGVSQPLARRNAQRTPADFNTVDFRSASHALRASLLDTSRRGMREGDSPSRNEALGSSFGRHSVALNDLPGRSLQGVSVTESERSQLSASRDGWETQLARSQFQLERVRQLLHSRSSDSRERETSRRHLSNLSHPSPAQSRRRSFLSTLDTEILSSTASSESPSSLRRSSLSGGPWSRIGATSTVDSHSQRPFALNNDELSEQPPAEIPSRNMHEILRASSLRGRRRRTLLPESSSRRDSHGFLHSVNNALHQVESGLLHINRELHALTNEGSETMRQFSPQTSPIIPQTARSRTRSPSRNDISSRMDWAFESIERNTSPPPTLPPFEFSTLQHNSDWPASRRNQNSGEDTAVPNLQPGGASHRAPTRGSDGYFEPRQNARDSARGTRTAYAYENSWRTDGLSNEWWSNDVSSPSLPTSMPLRDRLLFRASGAHQPAGTSRRSESGNGRGDSAGSSMQAQTPSTAFGRLHRRRLSPPAAPTSSSPPSLLRPFSSQTTSTSPPRSYASRFSHLLPRRNSGRGGGGGSSDDNEDWHHSHSAAEQASRRFFLRPRGRGGRAPPSNGDYLRDDEFDDSYEGLLRLAARIGDVKPRGTPADVIRSMPSCSYGNCPEAKTENRCPICLDDYGQEDVVTVIKRCSHWFHRECVQQWLSNSRTCPVCRGQADGEGDSEPQAGPSTNSSSNSWT